MRAAGRWASRWRAGLLVLLMVAAQGCWFQTGYDHTRGGSNPLEDTITAANVAGLQDAWATSLPGGQAPSDVVVRGGTAFVRTPGAVTALDTATGAERWTVTSLGGNSAPAIAGNRLWVPIGSGSCVLAALDPATGERLASLSLGGPNLSNSGSSSCGIGDVLAAGGNAVTTWVYLGSTPAPGCPQGAWGVGSGVAAFAEQSGDHAWAIGGGLTTGCGVPPAPPTPTRYLALSSDGSSVLVPAGTDLAAYPVADCGAPPACQPTWSRSLGAGMAAPAVALDNGDVAVPMADGRVIVLDGATGETRWTGNAGAALRVPLAATATTIFAAADDRTLAAFPVAGCGAATCAPAWTATTSAPASDQPSIGGDVVYVGDAAGAVTAFPAAGCGAATCEALWSDAVADGTSGPPVVFDGTLYVGGDDGRLSAFRLPAAEGP